MGHHHQQCTQASQSQSRLDGPQTKPAGCVLTCGLELIGNWAALLLGVRAGTDSEDGSAGAAAGRAALLVASISNAWLRR